MSIIQIAAKAAARAAGSAAGRTAAKAVITAAGLGVTAAMQYYKNKRTEPPETEPE